MILHLIALLVAQTYVAPRVGGKPDLQGFWQVRNTANWNIQNHNGSYNIPAGIGVVEGDEIPYQPSALAKKQENYQKREAADPMSRCYIAGVPRTMYLPYPFQILQTSDAVVIMSEYVNTWRYIPTFNLSRYEGYDSWMGDPRGHWEGDTLVVDTTGFNDQTWFDHAGNFHSDALKVTERFTRTGANTLNYDVTIEDPKTFTKPWKMKMTMYRVEGMTRLLENECYLDAEDHGDHK